MLIKITEKKTRKPVIINIDNVTTIEEGNNDENTLYFSFNDGGSFEKNTLVIKAEGTMEKLERLLARMTNVTSIPKL